MIRRFQFISRVLKPTNELLETDFHSGVSKWKPAFTYLFYEYEGYEIASHQTTSREELALFNRQVAKLIVNLFSNLDDEGYHFYFSFLNLIKELLEAPTPVHNATVAKWRASFNSLFDKHEGKKSSSHQATNSREELELFNQLIDQLVIKLIAILDDESYHLCLKEKEQGTNPHYKHLSEEEFMREVQKVAIVPYVLDELLAVGVASGNAEVARLKLNALFEPYATA